MTVLPHIALHQYTLNHNVIHHTVHHNTISKRIVDIALWGKMFRSASQLRQAGAAADIFQMGNWLLTPVARQPARSWSRSGKTVQK